jgi:hypothetical protein
MIDPASGRLMIGGANAPLFDFGLISGPLIAGSLAAGGAIAASSLAAKGGKPPPLPPVVAQPDPSDFAGKEAARKKQLADAEQGRQGTILAGSDSKPNETYINQTFGQ